MLFFLVEGKPMERTITLNLPESVYQVLVRKAEQSGRPPEALAIELLASATVPEAADPLEAFIGAFDSQGSDWADRHDAHLGTSLEQKLRGR
jgi:hypothetical protein